MRKVLISVIALVAHLAAPLAFGSCVITEESSDTIVRARFVRCEDARPYLESGGVYRTYERDLERELARRSRESGERLLALLEDSVLGSSYEARVAVVSVEAYVLIVPWLGEGAVELKDQPQQFRETIRYWWSGPVEDCDSLASGSSVDLWVHSECCDTPVFAAPVCLIGMNYAELVPDEMDDVVTGIFGMIEAR